ncbi:response regulator transcription factor [Falsiroseomonas sp. E2-1-a20]|uniref:response regulator transcription factor n=1 Tax=Falsiroseomonas sp. E2-1-a20 TaxID=3239300 RepID=UPI003F3A23A2
MAFARQVLVVEDDVGLRRLLTDVIATDPAFTADGAGSIAQAEALLAASGSGYDAILLDLGLPDGDGGEFCERLRHRGVTCPIIMLTGCVARGDLGRGLDCGASDYLAKPVGVAELMRRLRLQLDLALPLAR